MKTALTTLGLWALACACSPSTSRIEISCGSGTTRAPATGQCVKIPVGSVRCGAGTRTDRAGLACVAEARTLTCARGTLPNAAQDGCTLDPRAPPVASCRPGTTETEQGQCVAPLLEDDPYCGPSTTLGADLRCAPKAYALRFEPVDDGALDFDIRDVQVVGTIVHLFDPPNGRVVRVDLTDGRVLDEIVGSEPVFGFQVDPRTGDVFLMHAQRVDVFRVATARLSTLVRFEEPIMSMTVTGEALLVASVRTLTLLDLEDGSTIRAAEMVDNVSLNVDNTYVETARAAYLSSGAVRRVEIDADPLHYAPVEGPIAISSSVRDHWLRYLKARDQVVTQGGTLIDPATATVTGQLATVMHDIVELDGLLYAITGHGRGGGASLLVMDASGARLSQTLIDGTARRLVVADGALYLLYFDLDRLRIRRVRRG